MSVMSWLPAILTGYTAITKAKEVKAEGNYESGQLAQNSMFARMQADDAKRRGESSAMRALVKGRSMIGSQKAAMAAQGIDVSSGSAVDVMADTGALTDIDVMTIRNNAAREAWGLNVASSDAAANSTMVSKAAASKSRSTLITGGLQTLRLIP